MFGYVVIYVTALVARLALTQFDVRFVTSGQATLWSWAFFPVFSFAYWSSVLMARYAPLPSPGDTFRCAAAIALPAGTGVVVGVLTICSDLIAPVNLSRGVRTVHVTGAAALPFYAYGAVLLTSLFHFLPVAAVLNLARAVEGTSRTIVITAGIAAVAMTEDLRFFLNAPTLNSVESLRHLLSVAATLRRRGSSTGMECALGWCNGP